MYTTLVRATMMFMLSFFFTITFAQKRAVTESGDEVILYENGTWQFVKNNNDADSIKTNPTTFKKSSTASFLMKSQKGPLGFWLDPKKWSFKKAQSNAGAEFELELKGESLQGMILTEPSEIPIESYVYIALENGKSVAPDIRIIKKEYRIVNGLKVLMLQMEGTQSGLKFTYFSYYFSAENITVQFVAFTYQNLLKKYLKDIEELLNGLVQLKTGLPDSLDNKNTGLVEPENPLHQSSISTYQNCKPYFTGNWAYSMIDKDDLKRKEVKVKRTLDKTYEYTDNNKYVSEYGVNWINDCKYELIFKKTTKPNFNQIKIGEKIEVEITLIDKDEMQYRALFRGKTVDGTMAKINNLK